MSRSKLQSEVISLYKRCLAAAKDKPSFTENIRYQFRQDAQIPRNEILRIEYLLRQGNRKLKMIQDPHVSGMGRFEK